MVVVGAGVVVVVVVVVVWGDKDPESGSGTDKKSQFCECGLCLVVFLYSTQLYFLRISLFAALPALRFALKPILAVFHLVAYSEEKITIISWVVDLRVVVGLL